MILKTMKITLAAMAAAACSFPMTAAEAAKAPAAEAAKAPAVETAKAPAAEEAKPVTLEQLFDFLPDVLAEVGSAKITKADLLKQIKDGQIAPEMLAGLPVEMRKGMAVQAVNEQVDRLVCLNLAEKAGFVPSEKLVKDGIDEIFNKLPDAQKKDMESKLKAIGKTFASYRDDLAKNPEMQKNWACSLFLQKAVADKAKDSVTDADVEKFYRENQALFELPCITVSHILVQTMPVDLQGKPLAPEEAAKKDAEAKAKIDKIYAQLKQGVKFEELAEKESDCPSGKQAKGKLPSFTKDGKMAQGRMDPVFTAAAVKLEKPGEVSEIVKTPFGYHIIRLEEKKPQTFVPLNEVKDEIRAQLTSEKIDEEIRNTIETGKKGMNIKINVLPPELPSVPEKPADPVK